MTDIVLLIVGAVLGSVFGLVCAVFYQDRWKARVARRKHLRLANAVARMHPEPSGPVHIAGKATTVHLLEGDGNLVLDARNITIRLRPDAVDLPDAVAACRDRVVAEVRAEAGAGVASTWNSDSLVALCGYRIGRSGGHEASSLDLDVAPADYATFAATVLGLDREFDRPDGAGNAVRTTLRRDFLATDGHHTVARPLPFLANGVGVALVGFTDDDRLLLTRRRPSTRARPGERDVSVVEGMHTLLDRKVGGTLSAYTTAVRGCREELGVDIAEEDVRLLGFAVDMTYYQWNFLGLVDLRRSAGEVLEAQLLHAKDRWESRLEPVPIDPVAVFTRIRADGIWDLGLVAAYLALCFRCGPNPVRRAAEQVFGGKPDRPLWRA
ncbi:hypothetical protein [Actinokineospora sp.]|uniref:hypothetical protein n=1 Tax=Actinokineospora sp. TaxID=1872133 RepID=UPI0040379D51